MNLEIEGKNQVYVNGARRYVLSNAESRNAARRVHTADLIRKLAVAQADLDGVRIDKKEILDRVTILKIIIKNIEIQVSI